MQKLEWRNQTIITEFILLGFGDLPVPRIVLFLIFLMIYVITMSGNLLIVVLVVADHQLHTPMYFFLGNLSCLETCYSSTILPRLLASLFSENQRVPVNGCIAQFGVFGLLVAIECYLLAAMSYDRYIAICRPLHYSAFMNFRVCLHLMTVSWLSSFVIDLIMVISISQLTFCGHNVMEHFFCDFTPMMKLACTNADWVKLLSASLTSICILPPFVLTITSYAYIIAAILAIPSTTGRKKAFSTCSSHLIVLTIFYGSLIIVYFSQDTKQLKELNKVFSVFYTILTPLLNPLIYSLRNKEVKEAIKRVLKKCTNCIRTRH